MTVASALLTASYAILWVLVIALTLSVLALYRHFGLMYINSREGRASQGPEVGAPLRALKVTDVTTSTIDFSGRRALLLFTSVSCPLCAELKAALPAISRSLEARNFAGLIFCEGRSEEIQGWSKDVPAFFTVVADPSFEVATKLRIGSTPFAVTVGEDGVVQSKGIVNDETGITRLLGMPSVVVGAPTPRKRSKDVEPDLIGGEVR